MTFFAGAPVCFHLLLLPLLLLLLPEPLLLLLLLLLLLSRACVAGRPCSASSAGICACIGSGRTLATGRRRGLRAWAPVRLRRAPCELLARRHQALAEQFEAAQGEARLSVVEF